MAGTNQTAPLTLYLQLEKGQSVSLETAGRLSVAWNDLIIEIFAVIDPSAEVRVELLDAVEGSLWLRSLVKAASKVAGQHPLLAGAISGILATFFGKPVDDLAGIFWPKVYEAVGELFNPDPASPERQKLAEQCEIAQRPNVATRQKAELFNQLERAPAIVSATASPSLEWRPSLVVPRSEFATRAGLQSIETENVPRQTIVKLMKVILLTAKLEPKELTWRFADLDGEPFSAIMRDGEFIKRLESGRTGIELRIGVDMEIEISIKRELLGGVWVDTSRSVTKVIKPEFAPLPPSLPQLFDR